MNFYIKTSYLFKFCQWSVSIIDYSQPERFHHHLLPATRLGLKSYLMDIYCGQSIMSIPMLVACPTNLKKWRIKLQAKKSKQRNKKLKAPTTCGTNGHLREGN